MDDQYSRDAEEEMRESGSGSGGVEVSEGGDWDSAWFEDGAGSTDFGDDSRGFLLGGMVNVAMLKLFDL